MMNFYDNYKEVIVVLGIIIWQFASHALADWLF